MRLYKVWRSTLSEGHVLFVWANDADEAFHRIARKIDPKVVSFQWTGVEDPNRTEAGLADMGSLEIEVVNNV